MDNDTIFIAPEGVYTMTEEHKPPPPHANLPSTQQIYPTRLSTVVVKFPFPKSPGQGFTSLLGGGGKNKESEKKDKKGGAVALYEDSLSSSEQGDENSADAADLDREKDNSQHHPATASLFSPGPDANLNKKKSARRPGKNIGNTSSSFVTRLQSTEGLNKQLASKSGDVTFLFYNSAKSFFWTELGTKAKEPLARITFSAHPTCHDINRSFASHNSLDVVIGFNTGDLVWFDPLSSRYVRLNKGGCISSSPCTAIHWVPSSRSLFMVSHADGTIIVYDKEREDSNFSPRNPGPDPSSGLPISNVSTGVSSSVDATKSPSPAGGSSAGSRREDSSEWLPLDEILVTPGPSVSGAAPGSKDRMLKNPVSHWKISRKPISSFAFSPDVRHVAVGGEDGCLRVIDALSERLLDTYAAYFGSITCVTWSSDGRFILAGGQDDLLTIFAPFEQRVVARCQGHSSFVSGIAFDDLKCNGRTYRFSSVGEDNKLILWDFSAGAIHRPKMTSSHQPKLSLSSTLSLALRRREPGDPSTPHLAASVKDVPPPGLAVYHPAPSRNDVPILQPVLVKPIEGDLLAGLLFLPSGMFTVSRAGCMKFWVRPLPIRTQRHPRGARETSQHTVNTETVLVS